MIEPTLSTSTPPPEEDVTTTLYRAAIGPVSTGYYLPIFTRFEAADRAGVSWNTAAGLLTLNWLVFRKLWVAALAYVGALVAVGVLVFGIGQLVFKFSDSLLMALGLGFGLAAFVLPGLFGNALFHTECRKAMAKALTGHANVADARDALLRQASDRNRLIKLAAVNLGVLLLSGFAYQQFSALSNLAVMPHGALEAGNIAVGRVPETASIPITMAPAPIASAATLATVPDASASASAAVSAPAAAVAVAASEPVSTPALANTAAPAPATAPLPASTPASEPASTPTQANAKAKAKAPAKPAAAPIVAKAKAPRAVASAAKPKAVDTPKKAASAPPGKAFFINVGLFGVPENAAKAHAKLLEAGLPSVMKELKAKTRQIRVRVGPFASQAQASAAAEKIKALQLDASIVQL